MMFFFVLMFMFTLAVTTFTTLLDQFHFLLDFFSGTLVKYRFLGVFLHRFGLLFLDNLLFYLFAFVGFVFLIFYHVFKFVDFLEVVD